LIAIFFFFLSLAGIKNTEKKGNGGSKNKKVPTKPQGC
jgi:hypothetical protein